MGSGRGKTRRAQASDPRSQALAARDYERFLALHGHEEALAAFVSISDDLDGSEYWKLLRDVWIRAEQVEPRELWQELLSDHYDDHNAMMDPEELAELEGMPEEITVYRGVGNPDHVAGFSWTLDRDRAQWFSMRFLDNPIVAMFRLTNYDPEHHAEPHVLEGVVSRDDVIAYIKQRDEAEIVVLPQDVEIVSGVKLAPAPARA